MTIQTKNAIYPKRQDFIPNGSWIRSRKQTQILKHQSAAGTSIYTIPTGKVLYLTSINITHAGSNFTQVDLDGVVFFEYRTGSQGTTTNNYSPALKFTEGQVLSKNASSGTINITGMEENA